MIGSFSDLLQAARNQSTPQRLLLLFAQVETGKGGKKNKQKQHGSIAPLMCVDKLPEELDSFEALVAEADNICADWQFLIVAGLSGEGDQPPSPEQAEPYLNQMANAVASGQDLSGYAIFDRDENPVMVQPH